MRIFVVEKPTTARELAPHLATKWPEEEMMFLSIATVNLVNFTSPRALPYQDYPLITDAFYKPNLKRWGVRDNEGCFVIGYSQCAGKLGERMNLTIDDVTELLAKADSIVCATDWDASGMWGFDFLLAQCCPQRHLLEHQVLKLDGGYDAKSIKRCINSPLSTRDESYLKLLNAGKVKRYFDYNFNTNSLVIFGKLYRELTGSKKSVFISKYMLQAFLYFVEQGSIKHFKAALILQQWKGTGKYSPNDSAHTHGMGTPASRGSMLKNLTDLGLLKQDEHQLQLSELGTQFASALHKDCCDPDLPFRLDAWMCMPFEEAKTRIDSYLMRLFGKQKRYQN